MAKVAKLAAAPGLPGPIGLQNAWSLVERGVELDLLPMAQVALAWVLSRFGMSSLLLGASRPQQVTDNMASLVVQLSEDQVTRLNAVSAPPALNPYCVFQLPREVIFGGTSVTPWLAT